MKKVRRLFVILPLLVYFISLGAANPVSSNSNPTRHRAQNRTEQIYYQETFETGASGWTHTDATVPPNNWHIHNAGAPQGNVWWMGDPGLGIGNYIGGYHNSQYLVLDTPEITVPSTNASLTFKLRFNLEPIDGGTPPYDGWDACNVRISVDNGTTWTVISGTPAYNITSAHSFGDEHGEGAGIAGWGGNSNGWGNAVFNLSAYAGQNVKIRFAFASDDAYSTVEAPALVGMMVDDIALGSFSNNGVNNGQLTWASLVPPGGDLWHVGIVDGAPSLTHAMICQNGQGSYNPGMVNYLISPPIEIPANGDSRADMMIKGSFSDPDSIPDVDYFMWEVSVDNGMNWNSMTPPYPSPDFPPQFWNIPATWTLLSEFTSYDFVLSDYAGETAIFRIAFYSDNDTPEGAGIMIDDFTVWYGEIDAPTDLTAVVNGYDVTLNWDLPGLNVPGWIHYGDSAYVGPYGAPGTGTYDVAIKWDPTGIHGIEPCVGKYITSIRFISGGLATSYAVRIYAGSTGQVVYEQQVSSVNNHEWNEIVLTTPYLIPENEYLWVGYRCTEFLYHSPCGLVSGQVVPGYGDMINMGSNWSSLYQNTGGTYHNNWAIQAYISDTPQAPGVLAQVNSLTRDITSYNIYRDDNILLSVNPDVNTYTDFDTPAGYHHYYITAVENGMESQPSNTVTIAIDNWYEEIYHDDNSAETGYEITPVEWVAVKFDPYDYRHGSLRRAKIYVASDEADIFSIRIYDSTGDNGGPGNIFTVVQDYPDSIVIGWNYFSVSSGGHDIIPTPFYIAVGTYTYDFSLGLDTDNAGYSYKQVGFDWVPIPEGELMIRAIFEECGAEDDNIAPAAPLLSLYPNPVLDKVTLSFREKLSDRADLKIFNAKGQLVRKLSFAQNAGPELEWDATDNNGCKLPNGVYFLSCDVGKTHIRKKLLLMK